jgi:branched-chain amino acid aminotransferase
VSQPIVYVNGNFVPASEAALPIGDLGIVRGYGVFDVLRTYNRLPFRLRDHVQRLQRSARAIGITLPWTTEEIEETIHLTHDRNTFTDSNIRIIVTGGSSINFMTPENRPSLIVMVTPTPVRDESHYRIGCSATTAAVVRERPSVKSLNYIGAVMAVEEARSAGAIEALYRTEDGSVTEGTRANLFVLRGRRLITPKDEILDGITRKVVLELAAGHFEIAEEPIPYATLSSVDEAFITSTTKEVLPIVRIDDMTLGAGQPGPHTQTLANLFRNYVESPVRV